MSEKKYYCFCSSNCRYETMTKEQILAAIAQAVETGRIGDCDTGFVTKVKEGNGGGYVTFWVGTRAQYNALSSIENNCVYIITDDTSAADLVATVEQAAADAAAAAASVTAVDISDKVKLNVDMVQDGCEASITVRKCIYNKTLGVVFFVYVLNYNGNMNRGADVGFTQSGGYAPRSGAQYGVLETHGVFSATYMHSKITGTTSLTLNARDAIEGTEYGYSTELTGWYFCDGE